ncbi:MAG: response regulator transcription factor [Alphaproteobacteria bacterium]
MTRQVLVVEDNDDIGKLISLHLSDLDCQVRLVGDGRTGFEEARTGRYDLIVLDLNLPGMEGLELCKRLRQQSNYTPILMLTARSSEMDRVLGLELGADDYVTKPFSIHELLARVKAIFRRAEEFSGQDGEIKGVLARGAMAINVENRSVTIDGKVIDLTAREFDLLLHFANHPGRVYSRTQLLDEVWGYAHDGYEHTVNSHINRLRSKIEDSPAKPTYVLTVWGVGYKFNDALPG